MDLVNQMIPPLNALSRLIGFTFLSLLITIGFKWKAEFFFKRQIILGLQTAEARRPSPGKCNYVCNEGVGVCHLATNLANQ